MKKYLQMFLLLLVIVAAAIFLQKINVLSKNQQTSESGFQNFDSGEILREEDLSDKGKAFYPLTIDYLKSEDFSGSDIVIEQTLDSGSNYNRYIASYKSEGLKIYGLLTVPTGEKPKSGWPVVIFNHGFIQPSEYRTTERYVAYVDAFARNGYVVFKSDYRGHGDSEGDAAGGYGSPAYTVDVINAVESIKKYKDADPDKIGMWGHSMGGFTTIRTMVARKDVKAGVIWAGVVASYPDLINNWRRGSATAQPLPSGARRWRQVLTDQFGEPKNGDKFWDSISANTFLATISGPLQLHHATGDASVPVQFSRDLEKQLKDKGRTVEYYEYVGDDHNIAANFGIAIQRSVDFFDKYLKGNQ